MRGVVEVRDRLAKTMLDLEKCCRGGGRGQEIRICISERESGQMELKIFGRT